MGEAEARAAVRMVEGMGLDPVAVREDQRLAGREAVVGEAGGELVQLHREEGRSEDPVENGLRRLAAPAAAMDVDRAVAEDRRLEERQPADMIEMQVAEEDVDLGRRLRPEGGAERRQARAGVDDEQSRAATDLDAGRVPAELAEAPARRGQRAAHTPEPHLEGVIRRGRLPEHHDMVTRRPVRLAVRCRTLPTRSLGRQRGRQGGGSGTADAVSRPVRSGMGRRPSAPAGPRRRRCRPARGGPPDRRAAGPCGS